MNSKMTSFCFLQLIIECIILCVLCILIYIYHVEMSTYVRLFVRVMSD